MDFIYYMIGFIVFWLFMLTVIFPLVLLLIGAAIVCWTGK